MVGVKPDEFASKLPAARAERTTQREALADAGEDRVAHGCVEQRERLRDHVHEPEELAGEAGDGRRRDPVDCGRCP
jgi:hypothetical protein